MVRGKVSLLALDIGSWAIKAVQLKGTGEEAELLHLAVLPLDAGVIEGSRIQNQELLIQSLSYLLRSEKIKARDVVVSVGGPGALVRQLRLPRMSDQDLSETIPWEVEQYVPFPREEVQLELQVLGEGEEGGDRFVDVLLVAVRRSEAQEYAEVLSQVGLKPQVLDLDLVALENSYEFSRGEGGEEGPLALVDVGASFTHLNICWEGRTLLAHPLAIGGNRFTERLQKELGYERRKAECLKMGLELEGEPEEKLKELLREVTLELARELATSFRLVEGVAGVRRVAKMILSGGGAQLRGMDRCLEAALSLPVEIANPFRHISFDEDHFDPDFVAALAPLSAVSVGAAARTLD